MSQQNNPPPSIEALRDELAERWAVSGSMYLDGDL